MTLKEPKWELRENHIDSSVNLVMESLSSVKLSIMRSPQNLKKSPTCFDQTAVFTQYSSVKTRSGIYFSKFYGMFVKVKLYPKSILFHDK